MTTLSARVDSGFDFLEDAFVFENFGGDAVGTQLDARLLERMFGTSAVCEPDSDPCELTDVARAWMGSTNATLDTGRSEGFATLSLLFYKGVLDPKDFGAETVAELELLGNPALQDEFAYWAGTQAVPSTQSSNERYAAKDVMPFLEKALAPGAEGAWRLAIAQKTEIGFQRGHALVPMGYFRGEGGVYWLRIYDNNFPSEEQRLEIDPEANTWRYVVTGLLDEEIVYEGSSENGNLLYFANVLERTDVLQAPFAPDSEVFTVVTSGMTAVVEVGGEQTGLVGGKVVEFGDDRVTPAFSSCPLCGNPVNIVNQALIDKGVRSYDSIEVRSTGDYETVTDTSEVDRRAKSITSTSAGSTTTVRPTGPTENDEVEFGRNGGVKYQSSGGNAITIESTVTTEDGGTVTVKITVAPPEGAGEFVVSVEQNEGGRRQGVSMDDVPEGTSVTYEITKTKGDETSTSNVTFDASGDTTIETSDDDGTNVRGGATNVDPGTCSNGTFDPLTESDVDCGDLCGICRHGQTCKNDEDCTGRCIRGVCDDPQCTNDRKDGDESDVDCGGTACAPCAAANDASAGACALDSDCDSNLCLDAVCRRRAPIKVVIPRLIESTDARFTIEYRLDGGPTQSIDVPNYKTLSYPHTITLGDAFSYAVDFAGPCRTDFGREIDLGTSDTLTLDCPSAGSRYLILKQDSAFRPAADDLVKLRVTLDGVHSEIDFDGVQTRYLGTYSDSWRLRTIAQPLQRKYGNLDAFDGVQWLECANTPSFSNLQSGSSSTSIGRMSCAPVMNGPSCQDNRRNQNESSRDCGGVCGPCDDFEACNITRDCNTRECDADYLCGGASIDTCTDGRKNVGETDVDCGAFIGVTPQCPRCLVGQACERNGNCATGLGCEGGTCLAFGCDDTRTNGQETDVDCGGPDCDACADGFTCAAPSDCTSGVCDGNLCAAPTCSDSIQNQTETATDCGGTCPSCADGLACAQDTDCMSGYCNGSSICAAPTCTDGDQNGLESDVDCGGGTCLGCAGNKVCNGNGDCASNMCTNNVCVSMPTCTDSIQNQGETAVDCGGPNCAACAVGTACTMDNECASSSCECGSSSGNCAGASGKCSEGQFFIDQPVTDGTSASGTYTIPAGCTELYVQAWGTGGGGEDMMGFVSMQGGGGGFVDGTLTVTPGDTVTVWLGQGGKSGFNPGGAGSYLGAAANGGDQGFGSFGTDPGGGGGLTSVQITGASPATFSVPGGAGGSQLFGTATVSTSGGGGAASYAGDAGSNEQGGGGAGDTGGLENTAGAYGTLPLGLTSYDGDENNFTAAGTTHQDYARCQGAGMIPAGSSDPTFGSGGDGCVVLRCVGQ